MSAWGRCWVCAVLLGAAWIVGCGSDDDDDDTDGFYSGGTGAVTTGAGGITVPVTSSTGGTTIPVTNNTGGAGTIRPGSTGGIDTSVCPSSVPTTGDRCSVVTVAPCLYNDDTISCTCSVEWLCVDLTGAGGWGQTTGGSSSVEEGGTSNEGGAGTQVECPTTAPDNGDDCAELLQVCEVDGLTCVCSGNGWRCSVPATAQGGAAGSGTVEGPMCPDEAPDTGDACPSAGDFCPYDERICACATQDGEQTWLCQDTSTTGGGGAGNAGGGGNATTAGSGTVASAGSGTVASAGSGTVASAGSGTVASAGSGTVASAGSGTTLQGGAGGVSVAQGGAAGMSVAEGGALAMGGVAGQPAVAGQAGGGDPCADGQPCAESDAGEFCTSADGATRCVCANLDGYVYTLCQDL